MLAWRAVCLATVVALAAASCGVVPLPASAAAQQTCAAVISELNVAGGDVTNAAPSVTLAGVYDTDVAGLQRLQAKSVLRHKELGLGDVSSWGVHGPNDDAVLCFIDTQLMDDPDSQLRSGQRFAIGYVFGDGPHDWVAVDFGPRAEIPVAAP